MSFIEGFHCLINGYFIQGSTILLVHVLYMYMYNYDVYMYMSVHCTEVNFACTRIVHEFLTIEVKVLTLVIAN